MASLQKEVKSMDEDSWKFAGPRSQINLVSRPVERSVFGNGNRFYNAIDKSSCRSSYRISSHILFLIVKDAMVTKLHQTKLNVMGDGYSKTIIDLNLGCLAQSPMGEVTVKSFINKRRIYKTFDIHKVAGIFQGDSSLGSDPDDPNPST
ncbi:hypothetical protein QJS10_CPA10g01199 [Acorus calamus]|uniref:Uncharacterized protein n=1 Tax=Acorus calamus TaxID=4465 RepID=A0AAV9DZF1_ACOCL|nr:hypothetical protein QJS10_CPA10g01199 [Acorus calamus]